MSMLTPPGMGGEYRITGDRYPRMRRPHGRRRIVLGSLAAVTALSLLAWGTVQLVSVFTGGDGKTVSAAQEDCKPSDPRTGKDAAPARVLPDPSSITVNVYNATERSGLAKETADELAKRGFTIGEVDNAPPELDKKVKQTGLLLGTPKSEQSGALAVLAAHLDKASTRTDKARKGTAAKSVDLVIGDGYRSLTKPKAAQQTLVALTKPSPAPSTAAGC
ncbi:LytR C-terminal domain-containing protein [Streptomyces sp. 549]|uniref:LytR C-terminal domain-containing protein n=1 Tax=Streptomyces sp. 549 TaxID=3049076 RepID=UPI0024C38799|nr:LytR C-terminal domain-containing protein [Streptomyces sp. 549]MDK1475414.1 LytR C-terminal domain-containing protein [Streptomyces sp. 549]